MNQLHAKPAEPFSVVPGITITIGDGDYRKNASKIVEGATWGVGKKTVVKLASEWADSTVAFAAHRVF